MEAFVRNFSATFVFEISFGHSTLPNEVDYVSSALVRAEVPGGEVVCVSPYCRLA